MKKIFILGSSAAAVRMIEQIRSNDQKSSITLFSTDGYLPYDREKFPEFLSGEIKIEELFLRDEQFYKTNRIDVILDQTITRINLKRQKIHTEQKIQHDYDVLFASDMPDAKFKDIQGANKDGVYGLSRLNDIKRIEEYVSLIDTIIIESDNVSGLQAAVALAKRSREVYLVISNESFLIKNFDDERCENIQNGLEALGVKLVCNNAINEILGEKDLRAVRLDSGKVLSTQMVVLESQRADLRLLQDQVEIVDFKIPTTEYFQTNVDSFYAFDKLTDWVESPISREEFTLLEYLEVQGETLSSLFTTEQKKGEYANFKQAMSFGNCTINILGEYWLQDGLTKKFNFNELTGATEILWIKDGVLKSAMLINAEQKCAHYYSLLNGEFIDAKADESIQNAIEENLNSLKSDEMDSEEHQALEAVAVEGINELIAEVNGSDGANENEQNEISEELNDLSSNESLEEGQNEGELQDSDQPKSGFDSESA